MTYQELVSEIKRLSLDERLRLLEDLTRGLREDLASPAPGRSSLLHVRGMLKPQGPIPSDEELRDGYVRHLLEKYE